MSSRVPISHHYDIYRYWDQQRRGRTMPARRDISPSDVRHLLPYITLIDHVDGEFRYRLVGTAVSQELGRDLTGSLVGSYVTPPEYAAAILGIYEELVAAATPIFTTGEYRAASQAIHTVSRLILPLSNDGTTVNMALFTRIARFSRNLTAGVDWLKGAPGKVCDVITVRSLEHLQTLCADWERQSLAENTAA